jgi:transcriptional regulator with XRE-family HTH domain
MPKAQHSSHYRYVPRLLKKMREQANLTQRELGKKLKRPQSWIYNCETANRRVDVSEFMDWCLACGKSPDQSFRQLRKLRGL